jgi:thymidine kinase
MEGYLELAIGPMFSGKTSYLIQVYKKYDYIGKKIAVVNYADDTRYHETMMSTHDKIMIPCIQSKKIADAFVDIIKADVVIINEGQFFSDLYETVLYMVGDLKKSVYVCGLDGDFKRNRFGQILDLIPFCDKVEKLHALCSICKNGKPAIFSHRISREDSQIVIGSDNYMSLCRRCYDNQVREP